MTDAKLSSLPQLSPPFVGTELAYVVSVDGVDSRVLLQDLGVIGRRQVQNKDVVTAPAFSIVRLLAPSQVTLATNAGTQAQATAYAVMLSATPADQRSIIHLDGYLAGLSGLTPGPIFLGVAGGIIFAPLDPNADAGKYHVPLGRAISATEIIFSPAFPALL